MEIPTMKDNNNKSSSFNYKRVSGGTESPELQQLYKLLYSRVRPTKNNMDENQPSSPQPTLRRMKSIDNSVWDELEQLYKSLKEREKDYQTAVEIGKMLLEKNKLLTEEKNGIEQELQELKEEITFYLKEKDKTLQDNEDLKNEVKMLRIKLNAVESNIDLEWKHIELEQENTNLEHRLSKYGPLIQEYKEKNRLLQEEVETYKIELSESLETQKKLQKEIHHLSKIIKEEEQDIVLPNQKDDNSVTIEKLASLLKEMSNDNKQLREKLELLELEKENYDQKLSELIEENKSLRQQTQEQILFLEEKANRITQLQSQIEEMNLLSSNFSGRLSSSSTSLAKELGESARDISFGSALTSGSFYIPTTSTTDENSEMNSELKRLKKTQANLSSVCSVILPLKERLTEADLTVLSSTSETPISVRDLVAKSNAIIDGVIRDIRRQIIDCSEQNKPAQLLGELLLENCKWRKMTNELAADNQAFTKESAPSAPHALTVNHFPIAKANDYKLWHFLPLFDFFSGWQKDNSFVK